MSHRSTIYRRRMRALHRFRIQSTSTTLPVSFPELSSGDLRESDVVAYNVENLNRILQEEELLDHEEDMIGKVFVL